MSMEQWWNDNNASRKTCLSATPSKINPMWTLLGLSPGLHGARPATDRLRDGTVPFASSEPSRVSSTLVVLRRSTQFMALIGSWDPKSTTVRFSVASRTSYTQLQKNSTCDPLTIVARFYCWLVLRIICGWQQKCTNVGRLLQVATKVCTYVLTACSRVLPESLTGPRLVKKFPAFYGTQMFITAFTSARHLSLSWARSIQSMPSNPFLEYPS
jgi:hypothetical protein